jgi:protein involved in polysaccharide export with SLBB domain
VQEEVRRLPEKYRAVVVLCYWQGLTQEQAAASLGCPLGTVRSRLARGRELLRRRLVRRGLAPLAGAVAAGLEAASTSASISSVLPHSLVSLTIQAGAQVAAGRAVASVTSASVAALVQSLLGSMFMAKLKITSICVVFMGLGAFGAILAAPQAGSDRAAPKSAQRSRPEQAAQRTPDPDPDDAVPAPSTASRPAPPAPPIEYLEAGAKLFNTGDLDRASRYLDAANQYRDLLQADEQATLDAYLEELAKVQRPGKASAPRRSPAAAASPTAKAAAVGRVRPPHIVEPPDLLIVEVLEALPGRPISGERLVRPDGTISLGFYGDIAVAGLTIPEIKEKIIQHLRRFITDEQLGMVELDDETGEPLIDPRTKQPKTRAPKDSTTVFVDVTAYNSQNYYVEGEVNTPGRLPCTGGDTVLDVLSYAGGVLPSADRTKIRLVRSFPKGSPPRVLPVDYEEITMGTDSSTNYSILPNDRLVVPRDPTFVPGRVSDRDSPSRLRSTEGSEFAARSPSYDRGTERSGYFGRNASPPRESEDQRGLEQRIREIEEKLDKLLEMMGGDKENLGGPPGRRLPLERSPFAEDAAAAGAMAPPTRRRRGAAGIASRPAPRRSRVEGSGPSPGGLSQPEAPERLPELPQLPGTERSPYDDSSPGPKQLSSERSPLVDDLPPLPQPR